MKATNTITMKPSFFTLLVSILVGSTGCLTSDNNVGSLGNDSGVADGSGQVARDANPASTCAKDADCPAGLSCGYAVADGCAAKGVCIQSNCQGGACITPGGMCGCDGQGIVAVQVQNSGNSFTVLYTSAPSSGRVGPCTGIPDAATPDAASVAKDAAVPDVVGVAKDAATPDATSVGKDAAPNSPEAGAAHQCQLNANGTCRAVTSNTACTPFIGHRYDEGAGCYATAPTTLWCCATAAGDSCAWPPNIGCYQVATDGGVVAYWTPGGGEGCDAAESAKVSSAPSCPSSSGDAAVSSDAAAVLMKPTLPAVCLTDQDCCVAMDECMSVAYLVGQAEYASMVASIAEVNRSPKMCTNCLQPSVQVQCKGGFCVGEKVSGSDPLMHSHCGTIGTLDAGAAPAVSPHALVDSGTGSGSSPSTWSCGSASVDAAALPGFGEPCQPVGSTNLCAEGLICIDFGVQQGDGRICTKTCSVHGAVCPGAAPGVVATCGDEFQLWPQNSRVCQFLCTIGGASVCTAGTTCRQGLYYPQCLPAH